MAQPPQYLQTLVQLATHFGELHQLLEQLPQNTQGRAQILARSGAVQQDIVQLTQQLAGPPAAPAPPAPAGQQQKPFYQRNPWDVLKGK